MILLLGCIAAPLPVLEADVNRLGGWGEYGPFGVTRETVWISTRVTDVVATEVYRPSGESPELLVFLQGGFVPDERYQWLGPLLASQGVTVAFPNFQWDLAISEIGNVSAVRGALDDGFSTVGVAGHSLGGVVATLAWGADTDFDAVALLASYPAGEGKIDGDDGRAVLSVAGGADLSALPVDCAAGAARFGDATYVEVRGMGHYDWTDGATEAENTRGGEPTRPLEETRLEALSALGVWLRPE